MDFTGSFWLSFGLPVILILLSPLVSYAVWKRPSPPGSSPRKFRVEHALTTFVAGVSVLAIAIPLGTNLFFQLIQEGANGTAPGLVLAGLTLAVLSLITGGYLIYKLALEVQADANGEITLETGSTSRTLWIPTGISFQLLSMVAFIVISFVGLLMYILSPPHTATPVLTTESSHFAILKPLPNLGETYNNVVRDWGKPEDEGNDWLVYSTRDSYVTFCFTNDQLTKIAEIQKGVNDAVRTSC